MSVESALASLWQSFVELLPNIVAAITWIALGILIGFAVGKVVEKVIRKYVVKPLTATEIGKSIAVAGIDIASLIGGLTAAFIIALSLAIAIGYIPIVGEGGALILSVVSYLPYLIGGVAVLTIGILLSIILAKYIGSALEPSLGERYSHLIDFIENMLLIGLIAVMITVAFSLLKLPSAVIYPLLVGTVSIAMGVLIVVETTKTIVESNPDFAKVAPYLQFIVMLLFIMVGLSAIFSGYGYVSDVLKMASLGIAIALAIMLIPIAFYLVKAVLAELRK
jgi:hypothetical protein